MNKEINDFVDRIANKELNFGCEVEHEIYISKRTQRLTIIDKKEDDDTLFSCAEFNSREYKSQIKKIYGHPLLIGDILEKLRLSFPRTWRLVKANDILVLWNECGLTKSLQEIIAESGYTEDTYFEKGVEWKDFEEPYLKNKEARELLNFLISLNLK